MKNDINAEEFYWARGAELEIDRVVNRYNKERYHGPQKGDISRDVHYGKDLIVSWGGRGSNGGHSRHDSSTLYHKPLLKILSWQDRESERMTLKQDPLRSIVGERILLDCNSHPSCRPQRMNIWSWRSQKVRLLHHHQLLRLHKTASLHPIQIHT